MNSFRSLRLNLSAAALALTATAAISVSAREARAEPTECKDYHGRLCGKTEVCSGFAVTQCTSTYYYFVVTAT